MKSSRKCWRPSRAYSVLLVLLVIDLSVSPVTARPQTLRFDMEPDSRAVDRRWDIDQHENETKRYDDYDDEDAETAKRPKELARAIMDVLRTLPEEDLKLLEQLPFSSYDDDELPQGDMPMEDVGEDSVQELPSEEVPVNSDLESYRGELVVLDKVNSTLGTLNSTVTNETSTDDSAYPQLQKIARERNREIRLQDIRQQILGLLFNNRAPPVFQSNSTNRQQIIISQDLNVSEIMKNQRAQVPGAGEVYTEKVQSFYPSCYLPKNTDEELWRSSKSMNLWFDLAQPPSLQGISVNIAAAKLRLYKLSQENVTLAVQDACPPPISDKNSGEVSKPQKIYFNLQSAPFAVEDKKIRVSVYWYTRSLKRHRIKRKLLDSQMLSVYGEAWTEWNIRGAVKAWKQNGRNFGLAVEVEDEDGVLLPAKKFFTPMNCSKQASISSPIPGFLAKAIAEASNKTITSDKSHTFQFNTLLFPIVDLCTIESPESEKASYYHKVQDDLDKVYPIIFPVIKKDNGSFVLNNFPTGSNETDKHRIRHHNHHHNEEIKPIKTHVEIIRRDNGDSIEEITVEDGIEGHQFRKQIIEQKVIMKNHRHQDDDDR